MGWNGWNLEMIGIHHLGPDEASSNRQYIFVNFQQHQLERCFLDGRSAEMREKGGTL